MATLNSMKRMRNFIFLAVFLLVSIFQVCSSSQCNLGLKLYSIESGEAVCAPLSPYQCIHACEWNSSCVHTTHFTAFRGRRTFLTGMILTDTTFLVQCCASLSTIVEMTPKREPVCVWTPEIETVETRGSIRLDPPLDKNEYIRDAVLDRLDGQGRVTVRLQVCKFVVQRPHCDKEDLPVEDRHLYSLLLLRLSRIQLLLNQTRNQAPKEEPKVETQDFKDDTSQFAPSPLATNRRAAVYSVPVAVLPYNIEKPPVTHIPVEMVYRNTTTIDRNTGGLGYSKKRKNSSSPRARSLPVRSLHTGDSFAGEVKRVIYTATKPIQGSFPDAQISKSNPRLPITHSTKEVLTNNWRPVQVQKDLPQAPEAQSPIKSTLRIRKIHRPTTPRFLVNSEKFTERPSFIQVTDEAEEEFEVSTTARPVPTVRTIPPAVRTRPPATTQPPVTIPRITVPETTRNLYVQTTENFLLLRKQAALQGLLGCCQSQVPGCRHLCSPGVTKEDIENALYSRACQPLSMASMLKCFHQYYDTQPVRECCERPNRDIFNPNKLPPQCLNLCSSNFRISWEHLSCINYVPIIYECYHDLIE